MGRVRMAIAALLLGSASVFSAGCQNRLQDENQKLWQQNRELQSQMDANRSQPPAPAHVADPQPQAVAPPVRPADTQPAPAPPVAHAPRAKPDFGQETHDDPIAGTTTVQLPGDVFFDSGKATLKEGAKAALDRVATTLKRSYPGKRVRVEGHTDNKPIKVSRWKSNQELSEARAKTVRDYLVSHGLDSALVTTKGFGDTRPRGTDDAKNRRVEIVVLTRATGATAAE